jgi:histone acetyltransferase (RNA polymerase elongator complex component)
MVYVGCESGDDKVLECIEKGETFDSSKDALLKLKAAGIKSSVMILNGLGGQKFSRQHAINSAKLMNETQPEFVSTLVVSFPMGEERFRAGFNGEYVPLEQGQLFEEIRLLIDSLELDDTVFRSDHASNYLVLKGNLGADKARLLQTIDLAINKPGAIPLRQEWQRGL